MTTPDISTKEPATRSICEVLSISDVNNKFTGRFYLKNGIIDCPVDLSLCPEMLRVPGSFLAIETFHTVGLKPGYVSTTSYLSEQEFNWVKAEKHNYNNLS